MIDYRKDFAEYVKITHKDSGVLIGYSKLSEDSMLSTSHNVEAVTQEEYEDSLPKPPEPSKPLKYFDYFEPPESFNPIGQTFKESSD